jgi:hypothetical protein
MTRQVTDSDVVDAIALGLGTAETWSGADALEWIADVIGRVRWHPGSEGKPEDYVRHIAERRGSDPREDPFLSQYVEDDG